MKKAFLFVSLAGLFIMSTCKKEDTADLNPSGSSSNSAALSVSVVNSTVVTGSWRVTYFFDSGDETFHFSGYAFNFNSNGVLTATKNGTVISGTWTSGNDNSHVKLIINFTSPAQFTELSEDWRVTERTDTRIKLIHVSGGNGGTDYLTFERN
ncbi:MAG: hypothetical protein WKF88_03590 [Ferruginibacter sp.]